MKKKLLSMEEWKKNCMAEAFQQAFQQAFQLGVQQGRMEVLDQISQMIQNGCTLADVEAYVNESKRQLEDHQEAASG